MEQKVQTREEAQLEAERRKRFNDLNREIVEGYREAVSGQVRMLRAFWEITKDGLWQLEYDKVEDWLGFLYDAGVKYAARSTYYHKIGLIKKFIDVVGEDFALRLAAEHDGAVKLLETSQSLVFEKHGRGQAASFSLVKADASILTEDTKQYLEDLARSSSRQGLAKVKQDTKRKEFITADWAPDYFY